jgi:hypothetical protein
MRRIKIVVIFLMTGLLAMSQNDLDAIRYSRLGVNGSSRFLALGGAFGAIGADVSCAAYNPAGLALFRKGEISYSGAIKISSNQASIYNQTSLQTNGAFNFNNFGFAATWNPKNDNESRSVFAAHNY